MAMNPGEKMPTSAGLMRLMFRLYPIKKRMAELVPVSYICKSILVQGNARLSATRILTVEHLRCAIRKVGGWAD